MLRLLQFNNRVALSPCNRLAIDKRKMTGSDRKKSQR